MRPYRWLLAVLALAMFAAAAPAAAQNSPTRNNIVNVDADEPGYPEDLLSEEEVAKIELLQTGEAVAVLLSAVSPDDNAVLSTAGADFGFLDLNDGSFQAIDEESFGPLIPLPFFGFSSFRWLDDRTLAALAVNFQAERLEDLYVIVLIDRLTLEISAAPLTIPTGTDILSVSPDFRNYLLVVLPQEEEQGEAPTAEGGAVRTASVQSRAPLPGRLRASDQWAPAGMRQRFDQMLREKPHMLGGARLMQQDEETMEVTTEMLDLARWNAASGEFAYVTTIPLASALFGEAWSSDSRRLALSLISFNDPDQPRFVFDGALISEAIYRDATGNLRPADNPLLQGNNTYLIDFAGETRILRSGGEAAPPLLFAETWMPDNSTLVVQAWHPGRLQGRTHPIYNPQFAERASFRFYNNNLQESGRIELNLFSGPSGISTQAIVLSPDELILIGLAGSERHPYYYNRVSGELRNIADRAGTYRTVVSTNRSRQLVFSHDSFTRPTDIYRMGWDGSGVSRLTWLNEELRQVANLAEYPVSFRLRSGQSRVGTLIQPADAAFPPQNRQLIVWQEGGPGVGMNNQWLANVENPYVLLPSFGYSLLVVPLAGRPGYDPAIYNSLVDRANFGAIDIDEQAEVVRQAISRGWTSAGKIGITGCSYGGYFVWQSIIRHPDLYAAANPQCALVDVLSEWSSGYPSLAPYMEGVPPWANPAEYRADSPLYNADRVRTPVLSFHGSNDFLPIVHNQNMHLQLVNRGVPARMIRFVGEGHGLFDAQNQLYAAQEQISWFRTHLR